MTTEQAPGIPWHDHEWLEVTTIAAPERTYVCTFTGCRAEKTEPHPPLPVICMTCGQEVPPETDFQLSKRR